MNINKSVILSTAYFAPIQYYSKFIANDIIYIEKFENYNKQSYRNRCNIYGANGILTLSIPIRKGSTKKIPIKDVLIDFDTQWQKIHLRSLISAYKSSPFFEFYFDDLEHFFHKNYKYLIDLNYEILTTLLELLDIETTVKFTESYQNYDNEIDFREKIHPKKDFNIVDVNFKPVAYTQVFSDKHGYLPNLSILDLLFNEGPNALNELRVKN